MAYFFLFFLPLIRELFPRVSSERKKKRNKREKDRLREKKKWEGNRKKVMYFSYDKYKDIASTDST